MHFEWPVTTAEDYPPLDSPPIQFSFSSTATLAAGLYTYNAAATVVGNDKNITDNTLLYFRDFQFSADISVLHYQEALQLLAGGTDIPRFSAFLSSDANAPLFMDPIDLPNYMDKQPYKRMKLVKIDPAVLSGFFRGALQQTGNLAGINEITLTMSLYGVSVTNDNYIAAIKKNFPPLALG